MTDEPDHLGVGAGLSESEIIERFLVPLARSAPEALGLIDDAALLSPSSDEDLVVTLDTLIEGVHFLGADRPRDVAWKALGVNVSDLVAKAARPSVYLLSLALPAAGNATWLQDFGAGLEAAQSHFGCRLIGGDTVATPGPPTISITAIGHVRRNRMVRRSGAGEGDLVYVSGTIGDAALGLQLLQGALDPKAHGLDGAAVEHLAERYRRPRPRTGLIAALGAHASAAMDVSDGLVGDFRKLCVASARGGEIRMQDVPLSAPARCALGRDADLVRTVMTGGDDYEVLATVSCAEAQAFESAARHAGVPVSRIGRMRASGDPVRVVAEDGREIAFARESFDHF